jgi:hypothetical protein
MPAHQMEASGSGPPPTRAEAVNEANTWLVGGGVITMAVAPLALPILILTLVATVPLVLLALAPALAVALIAAPVLAAWRVGRWAISGLRGSGGAEPGATSVSVPAGNR